MKSLIIILTLVGMTMNAYAQNEIAYAAIEKPSVGTSTPILDQYVAEGGKFFPLDVEISGGDVTVFNDFSDYAIKKGDKILKINDMYAAHLVHELLPLFPAQKQEYQEVLLSHYFGFAIWNKYRWGNEVKVLLERNGKTEEVIIDGAEFTTIMK